MNPRRQARPSTIASISLTRAISLSISRCWDLAPSSCSLSRSCRRKIVTCEKGSVAEAPATGNFTCILINAAIWARDSRAAVGLEILGCNFDLNQDQNFNSRYGTGKPPPSVIIVISKLEEATNSNGDGSKSVPLERKEEKAGVVASMKQGFPSRSENDHEQYSMNHDYS